MTLSEVDKKGLLAVAREAVVGIIESGQRKKLVPPSGPLHSLCGAFVSLYVKGKLRGCIGTFSEEEPLYKNVQKMAVSAATTDTRFTPIDSSELDLMKIEISVLTPRIRIQNISEIIVGQHGIYMKKGSNRGTLLPQVAVNQKWSRDEFLRNCSKYKAGIGWDGWKTAELYSYEAIIISSD